jgi:hypothetical protein
MLGGIVSNLKNKVVYKVHKAVTDPDANQFAADNKVTETAAAASPTPDESKQSTTEPDTFSFSRLIKKIGDQFVTILKVGLVPFLALVLSMYVTNEMIVYSVPIRIIFFIFTFIVCVIFAPFAFILAIYYLCKSGYSYYINNLSDGPKIKIMPTIFALLPISTTKPVSNIGAFFMYPFTYPKTEKNAKQLPIIMTEYLESLKKSFTYYEKVQTLPFFAEGLRTLANNIEHLHDVPPTAEPAAEPTATSLPNVIEPSTPEPSAPSLEANA